ncbi:LOW QUALITY PROTEIN: hypothetical protein U9M48_040980 [Paspalum notatum var. saurae]|uniref:Reverse transcriptase domain-containing protein n=1 Tax=Paspalum notatum var. saurae TaxID=547442 RepID=A0AAQ3UPJ7_PASNO
MEVTHETTLDLASIGIQSHDLESLDLPFTENEVWATIKSLPSDKAPGPDGFTGRFYKACWPVIKHDILAALKSDGDGRNLHLLNSVLLLLIPKKPDAIQVKDFRPICSLVHSFAKLLTKLLANRLAPKLGCLVSANQSAFIRGRCIHNNFLLVQQMARFLHRQREPRLLLKLDISKAFDSVAWPFLLKVLTHLGFGVRWRDLLYSLLRSSSTRVLLNGTPGDWINHRRGLRQGDLLSSMLFILVMDVLNAVINKASENLLLQPLSRRNMGCQVFLYVESVVLFIHLEAPNLLATI